MYITRVCNKCDNNKFLLKPDGTEFKVECSECHDIRDILSFEGQMAVPVCKNCNNSLFKFRREESKDNMSIDFTCTECGEPISYIYIDDSGKEITYEERVILDSRKLIHRINEKVENLETLFSELKDIHSSFTDDFNYTDDLLNRMRNINKEIIEIKTDINDFERSI